jgi:hypothetical protein
MARVRAADLYRRLALLCLRRGDESRARQYFVRARKVEDRHDSLPDRSA